MLCSALLAGPLAAQPAGPIHIEETGRSPEAPLSPADVAYDERLRASMASAEAFQGPLAGGWTVVVDGRDCLALELADRSGKVDGAWRDLRRVGALDASGLLDQAERTVYGVRLRFGERVLVLHRDALGRWTGELIEGGRTEAASLKRRKR